MVAGPGTRPLQRGFEVRPIRSATLPRLRWVALLTDDLDGTVSIAERELGVPHCWTDPEIGEYGMDNALFALGDCFLEICTPVRETSWAARVLRRQGPGGLVALFQVAELEVYRRRAAALDIRVSGELPRRRFTAGTWEAIHLHPKDTGGLLISLDVCDPPGEFPLVDIDWRGAPGASDYTGYTGMRLDSRTPEGMAALWGHLLGRPTDDRRIQLSDTDLTISDTALDTRIATLEIGCRTAEEPVAFDLCSVRIQISPVGVDPAP